MERKANHFDSIILVYNVWQLAEIDMTIDRQTDTFMSQPLSSLRISKPIIRFDD